MEKLSGESMDIVAENVEKLKEIFPDVFSEGKIDFEALEATLGEYVDKEDERYSFTWNGKAQARRIAQTPSTGTLRPVKEESKDWDATQNLYIEGDNLEVLKLLQKSYHKKVKMIYIDPPYNTGKEFIYPDNFRDNLETYLEYTEQKDKEGNKLSTNTDTSGRYHTNWLNMMYPRLKLARNLLCDDGLIFISIDDNEVDNLRKICDEIFGESNFQGCVSRVTGTPTGGGNKAIVNEVDYVCIYSKTQVAKIEGVPLTEEDKKIYDKEDRRGRYLTRSLRRTGGEDRREDRPSMFFPVIAPDGTEIYPYGPTGYESRWICGKEKFAEMEKEGLIEWIKTEKDGKTTWQVHQKFYVEGRLKQPSNLWKNLDGNKKATREVKNLFDDVKVFDFPKPVGLIYHMLQLATDKNSVILDFFAGSGTTAHATMKLNANDNGGRRCISVQLPEPIDKKSDAYKAGYHTISEISKERIRRASAKIAKEHPDYHGDLGFKAFKLDSSNIKEWDADFENLQESLFEAVDNIKPDRSADDLLYEILLKYGLDLTLSIEELKLAGKKVYVIGFGALVVCLDEEVTLDTVEAIAKLKEKYHADDLMRVVFRDNGFKDAEVKTNAIQILKQYGIEDVKSV